MEYQRLNNMNDLISQSLSDLEFVADDKMLCSAGKSVIYSLINEFNNINIDNIKHNIELSQFYYPANGLTDNKGKKICDNCELVLRYVDIAVCVHDGHIVDDNTVGCRLSRGVVRLYVKRRAGKLFSYERIKVVNVDHTNTLNSYAGKIYQNNDEMVKISGAAEMAVNRSQSSAISKEQRGAAHGYEIGDSVARINGVINETNNSAATAQLPQLKSDRIYNNVPSSRAISAANTVANTMSGSTTYKRAGLTSVVVPGNTPVNLKNTNTSNIYSTMTQEGIPAPNGYMNKEVSLPVDANLAVLPSKNIATSSYANKTQDLLNKTQDAANKTQDAANKSQDLLNKTQDFTKKAEELWKNVATNTGEFYKKATTAISDIFKGGENTVVPVSKNLSVLTNKTNVKNLRAENGTSNLPNSSNSSNLPTNSERSATASVENRVARRTNMSIPSSSRVSIISNNRSDMISANSEGKSDRHNRSANSSQHRAENRSSTRSTQKPTISSARRY